MIDHSVLREIGPTNYEEAQETHRVVIKLIQQALTAPLGEVSQYTKELQHWLGWLVGARWLIDREYRRSTESDGQRARQLIDEES
jgi:hypothetical protein